MSLTKGRGGIACLASLSLFGLLYTQTFVHFIGYSWDRRFSVVLYSLELAWLCLLLINQARHWWRPNKLDFLVFSFWLSVALSIILRLELTEDVKKYLLYAPFMALLPYLCGRMFQIDDQHTLMRIVQITGMLIVPLLLIDRVYPTSNFPPQSRWPIFGYDHGRLLVGPLLAGALISSCFFSLTDGSSVQHKTFIRRCLTYVCPALLSIALLSTLARAWLIAGLIGTVIVLMATKSITLSKRLCLFVVVLTAMLISHALFLKIDPYYSNFQYEKYSELDVQEAAYRDTLELDEGRSNFENLRCRELDSRDSRSVRRVLYQDAVAMFLSQPFFGVGAAKFAHYSCWTKASSYPHSTILHTFAELGLWGGGIFLMTCIVGWLALFRRVAVSGRASYNNISVSIFALLSMFLIADQAYGNYFMASGTWLLLGIVASIPVKREQPKFF